MSCKVVSKDIEQAMTKLNETKSRFWENHDQRMAELDAAIESLNTGFEDSKQMTSEMSSILREEQELLSESRKGLADINDLLASL